MNLLPKSKHEFGNVSYWDQFFRKRKDAFEWYGEYTDLCSYLAKYIKTSDTVLNIGCGNSKLSEDMYDVGYQNVTNIDISEIVVKQMILRNEKIRPGMKYLVMDMTEMVFENESFNVILDKGTLDAIFTDTNTSTLKLVDKYFEEVHRVLKCGGRFVCITLAQSHICKQLIMSFKDHWIIRIHYNKQEIHSDSGVGARLPVYVFVMTKMKISLPQPMIEIAYSPDTKAEKFSIDDALSSIEAMQNYSILQNTLASSFVDDPITVELWSDKVKSLEPRYSVTIIDSKDLQEQQGKFAVFIVPEGRETEWLFSSKMGRLQLAEMAKFKRLAIACLHRGHTYADLDEVKNELSQRVMELAPSKIPLNVKVPFLTAGDDMGWREVLYENSSLSIGDFAVEDVLTEGGHFYRRLVLKKCLTPILCEARLISGKKSKKKKKTDLKHVPWKNRRIDVANIGSDYDRMISGLSFADLSLEKKQQILVLGLGGGGILAKFLNKALSNCNLICVESDPDLVTLAKTYFGLAEDNNLSVVVDDGVEFLQRKIKEDVKHIYTCIFVDVIPRGSDNDTVFTPSAMLVEETLKMYSTLLVPNGVVIAKIAGETEVTDVTKKIQDIFDVLYYCVGGEQHNHTILVAGNSADSNLHKEDHIFQASSRLQAMFEKIFTETLNFNLTDIVKEYKKTEIGKDDHSYNNIKEDNLEFIEKDK